MSDDKIEILEVDDSPKEIKIKKKTINNLVVNTTIDNQTGEVIETQSSVSFKVEKEPDFVKLYLRDIVSLNNLPSGMSKILMLIIRQMNYNNVVVLISHTKDLICDELNVSRSYVNKCINEFNKKGILIRVVNPRTYKEMRSVYMLDPNLVGKGSWSDINELRLSIVYKSDGKKELKSNMNEQLSLKLGI